MNTTPDDDLIVAHLGVPARFKPHWYVREHREDEPTRNPYRVCSYCGSMHPADVLDALEKGASASFAKGYKLYIDGIPNPLAGGEYQTYNTSSSPQIGEGWESYETGRYNTHDGKKEVWWRKPMAKYKNPNTLIAKLYTDHLHDIDAATFAKLAKLIAKKTGHLLQRGHGVSITIRAAVESDYA